MNKDNNKFTISALKFAISFVETMHGSVVGDPEYAHSTDPKKCVCAHGQTIGVLRGIIKELRRK